MSARGALADQSSRIGARAMADIAGPAMDGILARVAETSPRLADNLLSHAFGSVIADTALGVRERELQTLAMLGALGGCEAQLRTHIGFAFDQGVAPEEIVASAEQVSVYAGYPRALTMLATVRDVLAESGAAPLVARPVSLRDHATRIFDSGGDRPSMILLHALGLDWRMWSRVIPHLTPQYRVIAMDLRGFGAALGAPLVTDAAHYAEDVADLLDRLGIATAHVTGLSLGGSVALELALQRPDLVGGLTVIAATAWAFPQFEDRARSAQGEGMAAQIVPSLTRWFRSDDLASDDWPVRYARNCVRRAGVAEWCAAWRVLAGLSLEDRLGALAAPLSLIAGEVDRSTPPELMARLGKDPTVIADAPHMIALTHPAALAQAILSA